MSLDSTKKKIKSYLQAIMPKTEYSANKGQIIITHRGKSLTLPIVGGKTRGAKSIR